MTKLIKIFLALAVSAALTACNIFDNKVTGTAGNQVSAPGSGNTASGLISMSPSTPVVQFDKGIATQVHILFNRLLPQSTTLHWTIDDGTGHFTTVSGTLAANINSGEVVLSLTAVADGLYSGVQTFNLHVSGDNTIFASDVTIPLNIRELNSQPVVSFGVPVSSVKDGDQFTVPVNVSQACAQPVKIALAFSGSATSNDYLLTPAEAVTFAPGQTSVNLSFTIKTQTNPSAPVANLLVKLNSVVSGLAGIDSANKTHSVLITHNNGSLFSISGVTGGTDSISDMWLTSGHLATLTWTAAPSAVSYQAFIFADDGTTVKCTSSVLGSGTLTYTFAGCILTEGTTYRASVVVNRGTLGTALASNDKYPFINHTTAPTAFNIIGTMGGTDITPDSFLAGSLTPTVVWQDSAGENSYLVKVLTTTGGAVTGCPDQTVPGNVQAVTFPSTCVLVANGTYEIEVTALDAAPGLQTVASNPDMQFSVTSSPSGYVIVGVAGGTGDVVFDTDMKDGMDPIVQWQQSLNAVTYDVTIWNDTGMTAVRCPTINVPSSLTTVTFTGCSLKLNDTYYISVVAKDAGGTAISTAANAPFAFKYKAGLYISGTGGSYYKGDPITVCETTPGDVCNAANPYKINSSISEEQIRVSNSGVISASGWVSGGAAVGNGILDITTDYLYLDTAGRIKMTGLGYTADNGPCVGVDVNTSNIGAPGGCHAGYGSIIGTAAQGTATYGSPTDPSDMGSAGGTNLNAAAIGTTGGGVIHLTVNTELNFAGTSAASPVSIDADGATGAGYMGTGSGGSVKITATTISGTFANISASGGYAQPKDPDNKHGASGSGGRIALYFTNLTYTGGLSGLLSATHATGGNSYNSALWTGAAGTVYYKQSGVDTNGHIYADNGTYPYLQGVETPLPTTLVVDSIFTKNFGTWLLRAVDSYTLMSSTLDYRLVVQGDFSLPSAGRDLTVASGGYYEWRRTDPITLYDNITVQTGGEFSCSRAQGTTIYSLNLQGLTSLSVAGKVTANGKGYWNDLGAGAGTKLVGGAYGGIGGTDNVGTLRAQPYGNVKLPLLLGSSGSGTSNLNNYGGGAGGGIIEIDTNTLNLTGSIEASGNAASSGGGGSGGSIYVHVHDGSGISGNGAFIKANGGGGTGSGGAGSGGRISVVYDSTTYTGGITAIGFQAYGGSTGIEDGAAGTVFYQLVGTDVNGHLIVNNTGNVYSEMATTALVDTQIFDSITTDTVGIVEIPATMNYQLPQENAAATGTSVDYRIAVSGNFSLPGGRTELDIDNGGFLEWRQLSPLSIPGAGTTLNVNAGGVLTHTHNASSRGYVLQVIVDDMSINGTGKVDLDGRGYSAGYGPGVSGVITEGPSHGGLGGFVTSATSRAGAVYDTAENPTDLGSAGFNNGFGAAGGGTFIAQVTNLHLNGGTITAKGLASTASPTSQCGAGGAGGTISINADTIDGSAATLRVNGGNGVTDGACSGAGGGGGRIAIKYNTDSYTGTLVAQVSAANVTAYGGSMTFGTTVYPAAAGTIFIYDKGTCASCGAIYVDNGSTNPYQQLVETPVFGSEPVASYLTYNNGTILVPQGQVVTLPSSTVNYRAVIEGTASLPSNNLTLDTGSYWQWRKGTQMTLDNLVIKSGAILTHAANALGQNYLLDVVANSFDLQSGGKISLDGAGYAANGGIGAGTGSSGGSYGGYGGSDGSGNQAKDPYGSIQSPADIGSGSSKGAGGGFFKLTVNAAGTANLNGSISAQGQTNTGGAGGSIFITSPTCSGSSALFTVNGAANTAASSGGGGGGRISVICTTDSYTGGLSAMNMTAIGGTGNGGSAGAAGTIYYKSTGDGDVNGHLIVKNGSNSYNGPVTTPMPNGGQFDSVTTDPNAAIEVPLGTTYTLDSATVAYRLIVGGQILLPSGNTLTVASGGTIEMRTTQPLSFGSIIVASGGKITNTQNVDTEAYVVHLQATTKIEIDGTVDVSGMGYQGATGPGAGMTATTALLLTGGSHGGFGYSTIPKVSAANPYDSIKTPTDMGSGGGISSLAPTYIIGTHGGGYVYLDAPTGEVNLTGTILANAENNPNSANFSSAGAGGGIRIVADTLSGSGAAMQANGGNTASDYGNGGGGRISIKYTTDSYTGGISTLLSSTASTGGTSGTKVGGAGTIFYMQDAEANGHLIVDNKTQGWVMGSEAGLMATESFDSVSISTGSGVYIGPSATVSLPATSVDYIVRIAGTLTSPPSVTYQNGSQFISEKDSSFSFTNLTLATGAKFTHGYNSASAQGKSLQLNISGNLTMQTNALLDVSGRGYPAASGQGRGATATSTQSGGGAGHGGVGGGGGFAASGGAIYDAALAPTLIGSGGSKSGGAGTCVAGNGGGAVILNVLGTFDFSGKVLANGGDSTAGCAYGAGGGAGGAVSIAANTWQGSSGTITADGGGVATAATAEGGSGGGGLIHLGFAVDNYTGGVSAGTTTSANAGATTTGPVGTNGSILFN